ncbi:BGTF surface domain-containing protein [Halobellus salinisoli]|uniref:DUF7827 domain-containing protein n=1 Tax=Halobellus salinisoli TaxID=3108500 RepID=UPI003009CD07
MTGNTNKSRAVFLAVLMVLSVFAGTVAFTGSAAADAEYAGGAVEYNNSTDWIIEVPIEDGAVDPADVDQDNITLLDGGEDINDESVDNIYTTNNNGTVVLTLSERVSSNDLEVEFDDTFSSSLEGTYSVAFAAESYDLTSLGGDNNTYQGTTVAFYNDSNEEDFEIEGDDTNYFQSYGTGTNSSVFYVDTGDLELDTYDLNGEANLTVRDLGLSVEVDDVNVTTEETIDGTVEASASNRPVTIELLDSNDEEVANQTTTLSGQGNYDFSFSAVSETGDYTVEVTDDNSGVTTESSTITVSEAADDDADFVENTITDQRGDVAEVSVEMDSTDTATVTLGTSSQGVVSNVTVEDGDNDGEVTFFVNTYQLQQTETTSGTLGESDGYNIYSVDSDSDDEIVASDLTTNVSNLIDAGEYDLEITAGDSATADSTGVGTLILEERDTTEFRTWTAPDGASISDLEDVSEAVEDGELTQSSEIANGDVVVHELQASGFEGALGAQSNEDVTDTFFNNVGPSNGIYNLQVEQTDAGANQEPWSVNVGSDNTTVVADGDNDTYYVLFDTDNVNLTGEDAPSSGIPDDESLTANFTVYDNSSTDFLADDADEDQSTTVDYDVVEPTLSVSAPYNVTNAAEQDVGGTTSLAPGTELSLRVRSTDGTSPSFLKTASPVVQPDGTWSASLDFSEQSVGDTYEIVINDGSGGAEEVTEDGEVVESVGTVTDEPTTEEPTTEEPTTEEPTTEEPTTEEPTTEEPTEGDSDGDSDTSTPGFGVVVALTALLAAALLATRRN